MTQSLSPVFFAFGALRSGTTLFRLMLNAHEGVSNPGEADFLFDFLYRDPGHPTGWRYDRDAMAAHRIFKAQDLTLADDVDGLDLLHAMIEELRSRGTGILTLNVHRHADRIADILPQARIIHILRDPRDVARSSIGMGWSGTSWRGIDHWIETEETWERARFPEDRVLTLHFEDLMAAPETSLSRVCDFLGVPFSEAMLDYHLGTTYGPPNPAIAQQWQRKASDREIALLEGRCGELMAARGYARNGPPVTPGTWERIRLETRDKILRWRNHVRRFGLPLFLGAYLSRLPGFGRLKPLVRQRKEDRIIRLLK